MAVIDGDSTVEQIKAELPNLTPAELAQLPHVIALLDKIANTAGSGAATIADGADVAEGTIADAAATAGSTGTVSAKLRTISGSLGATTDAAVATDSNGSINAHIRGLITLLLLLTAAPSNASAAAATNVVVKNSPGTLYSAQGFNNKASAQYIQIHNASSLPADTAVPVAGLSILVPANSPWSFDFGMRGRAFSTGIVICNSSTFATKTIGSADCDFDAQFV